MTSSYQREEFCELLKKYIFEENHSSCLDEGPPWASSSSSSSSFKYIPLNRFKDASGCI